MSAGSEALLEIQPEQRPPPARLVDRFRDRQRDRRMAKNLRRATVPPPAGAFGSFGASFIVPPTRVDSPQCIFIGDGVHVLEYSWFSVVKTFEDIDPRFVVGDRTRIGRCCQFSCVGEIVIGSDVGISDNVLLADTSHEYEDPNAAWYRQKMVRPRRVLIRSGAVLGLGAIILPGVTIGRGAYVLDGSVVIADVPDRAIAGGNPAKIVRGDAAPLSTRP